ncbi:MAG: CPBP family intramembrane metalloprotease [Chitinophagaceae bacterium]|jgi:hypothetical protein|nr:CPBP family intramembrane metalloprotease [Chitinophagaceae bacterium]
MANYQLFALLVSLLASFLIYNLNPSSKALLSIGDVKAIAVKEKWLGINGNSNWYINGLQLLIFVSLVTSIFIFVTVRNQVSTVNFSFSLIPYILLFAFSNSLAEELIYRYCLIGGLNMYNSKSFILITSAILFGLPHFFGMPNGIAGVIISGILGYILCKATIETNGLLIAWLIHFIQDIIIFTGIFIISESNKSF